MAPVLSGTLNAQTLQQNPRAGGEDLTWAMLARRPELRPSTCTVNRDYNFAGGATVRAGTKVNIRKLNAGDIALSTLDGEINFIAAANETNALEVARAAWMELTPAQRELTYAALLQRMDIWPYRVKSAIAFEAAGHKVRAGDPLLFLRVDQGQLLVGIEGTNVTTNLPPQETDLITQARAILADERGAPGRLLEELAGKLVNPIDGKPTSLDPDARPKYVVLYFGASWCGPCQQFSPQLVKLLRGKAPKSADVALIYISNDRTPAGMKAYVTKLGIAWPTIRYSNTGQLPAFSVLFGQGIPQLVVTDRHGKVVVESAKVGLARAMAQLCELL